MRSLFVITGPIGVGKSSLADKLAKLFNTKSYSFDEYQKDVYYKILNLEQDIAFADVISLSEDLINIYKEKFDKVFIIKLTADYKTLCQRIKNRARPLEIGEGTELDLLSDCINYNYQQIYNCEVDTTDRTKESIFEEIKQIVIKMKADWNHEIQLPRAFTGQT